MNKGGFLAILAIIGYIGFELHTVNKARYRMEKPYVFDQFVSAHRAYTACRKPQDEAYQKFERNFALMRSRTLVALANVSADASVDVTQMLSERIAEKERVVDVLVASKGCADVEVWKLLRRFDIYAGKNLG